MRLRPACFTLILGIIVLIPFGYAQVADEALDLVVEVYHAIKIAEEKGADIEDLVEDLNNALGLLESGDEKGLGQISEILDRAIQAQNQGKAGTQIKYLQSGILTGLTFALVYFVWRFGPSIYWKMWVKTKRDWSVTR